MRLCLSPHPRSPRPATPGRPPRRPQRFPRCMATSSAPHRTGTAARSCTPSAAATRTEPRCSGSRPTTRRTTSGQAGCPRSRSSTATAPSSSARSSTTPVATTTMADSMFRSLPPSPMTISRTGSPGAPGSRSTGPRVSAAPSEAGCTCCPAHARASTGRSQTPASRSRPAASTATTPAATAGRRFHRRSTSIAEARRRSSAASSTWSAVCRAPTGPSR